VVSDAPHKPRASETELGKLHDALAKKLAEKIRDGTVTAAELSVARQFLKDNNISSIPEPGSSLGELKDSLPFPDSDGIAAEEETRH
jgi:hypothetical protein